MRLVVAEKPSVALAIASVLGATDTSNKKNGYVEGNGYIVTWCVGHLIELAEPHVYDEKYKQWGFDALPIIPSKWRFSVKQKTSKQYTAIKNLMNDSRVTDIVCATDAEREGECIFRYILLTAKCKKPVFRLWISSTEESAIKQGFKELKPSSFYDNLYAAGFARTRADWLVGINGTRIFTLRNPNHKGIMSVGRVQSATLGMVVTRDEEIRNFVVKPFYTVDIDCGGFKASSERIDDKAQAEALKALVNGKTATIADIKIEEKKENPPKLFSLAKAQARANEMFGFTAQQTLDLIQSLYDTGNSLLTYPRVDSEYIEDNQEETATKLFEGLSKRYGVNIQPNIKRIVNNKKVDAHHAIIPTMEVFKYTDEQLREKLNDNERKILYMVITRFLCAVSTPKISETTKLTLMCEKNKFTASGTIITDKGFSAIEEDCLKRFFGIKPKEEKATLPDVVFGQSFSNVKSELGEHETTPPKHYTDSTLLSAMEVAGNDDYDEESDAEKKGIGTPATRAGIIELLVGRGYIERKKKSLYATQDGINLIACLPDELKKAKTTAQWEMKLKEIEKGTYSKDTFMEEIIEFVQKLYKDYGSVDSNSQFKGAEEYEGKCPNCGGKISKGKFGAYCTSKCGMYLPAVRVGKLTDTQLKKLLSGEKVVLKNAHGEFDVLPEAEHYSVTKDGVEKQGYTWKIVQTKSAETYECPNCKGEVVSGTWGMYCKNKCGMSISKARGKQLSDTQVAKLLGGKSISFTTDKGTVTVHPETEPYNYMRDGKNFKGVSWKCSIKSKGNK